MSSIDLPLLQLPSDVSPIKAIAGAILAWLLWRDYKRASIAPKVYKAGYPTLPIPIIGSWIAAIRFLRNPVGVVRDGFSKTKNGMIRIATHQGEYVLVADRAKVSEYLKAPDNVLSMQDGANDQQQIPFTMGYGVGHRTYHVGVIKGPVTKKINIKTPDMIEEISLALDELLGAPEDYVSVPLYDRMAMAVARMSNRIYVGTRFCRNEPYLRDAVDYAKWIVISAELLRIFPDWLKK